MGNFRVPFQEDLIGFALSFSPTNAHANPLPSYFLLIITLFKLFSLLYHKILFKSCNLTENSSLYELFTTTYHYKASTFFSSTVRIYNLKLKFFFFSGSLSDRDVREEDVVGDFDSQDSLKKTDSDEEFVTSWRDESGRNVESIRYAFFYVYILIRLVFISFLNSLTIHLSGYRTRLRARNSRFNSTDDTDNEKEEKGKLIY